MRYIILRAVETTNSIRYEVERYDSILEAKRALDRNAVIISTVDIERVINLLRRA